MRIYIFCIVCQFFHQSGLHLFHVIGVFSGSGLVHHTTAGIQHGVCVLAQVLIPCRIYKRAVVELPCDVTTGKIFVGQHLAVSLGSRSVSRETVEFGRSLNGITVSDGGVVIPTKNGTLGRTTGGEQVGKYKTVFNGDGTGFSTTGNTTLGPTGTAYRTQESTILDGSGEFTGQTAKVAFVTQYQSGLRVTSCHF